MNIDDLTIGQAKELANMFPNMGASNEDFTTAQFEGINSTLNSMIGKKVIIRTYTAGVFFGVLEQKADEEVILKNARRMYYWKAKEGISLSACALYGVNDTYSKIIEPVESIWLKAIEIIPCTEVAIKSLEDAQNVQAK